MNANTDTDTKSSTSDAVSSVANQAKELAGNALDQAKSVASNAAGQATDQVRGLLGGQIETGAELVKTFAGAAMQAADFLDKSNPQFAGMIRNAATTADHFSGQMRDTSFEELIDLTSDFARKQPALFVGSAFAAGFLLARFAKSSSKTSTGSRS